MDVRPYKKGKKIKNEIICNKIKMAPIEDKMRGSQVRWFGHVRRGPIKAFMRGADEIKKTKL